MNADDPMQNESPPNPRVPTFVDLWARGLGVDVTLFDNRDVQRAIEQCNVQQVIRLCLENATDEESKAVFNNFVHKMELLNVITEYYGKKRMHSTQRFGDSDKDQIAPNHPDYIY